MSSLPTFRNSIDGSDCENASASTSPAESFHNEPRDRTGPPAPTKLWGSLKRMFDVLVTPRNARDGSSDLSNYNIRPYGNQLSRTDSSQHSSADVNIHEKSIPFRNNVRRVEWPTVQPLNDRDLQQPGQQLYDLSGHPPVTPLVSSPQFNQQSSSYSNSTYTSQPPQIPFMRHPGAEINLTEFPTPTSPAQSNKSYNAAQSNPTIHSPYTQPAPANPIVFRQQMRNGVTEGPILFSNKPPTPTTEAIHGKPAVQRPVPNVGAFSPKNSVQTSNPISPVDAQPPNSTFLGKPPRPEYSRPVAQPIPNNPNAVLPSQRDHSTNRVNRQTVNTVSGRKEKSVHFEHDVNQAAAKPSKGIFSQPSDRTIFKPPNSNITQSTKPAVLTRSEKPQAEKSSLRSSTTSEQRSILPSKIPGSSDVTAKNRPTIPTQPVHGSENASIKRPAGSLGSNQARNRPQPRLPGTIPRERPSTEKQEDRPRAISSTRKSQTVSDLKSPPSKLPRQATAIKRPQNSTQRQQISSREPLSSEQSESVILQKKPHDPPTASGHPPIKASENTPPGSLPAKTIRRKPPRPDGTAASKIPSASSRSSRTVQNSSIGQPKAAGSLVSPKQILPTKLVNDPALGRPIESSAQSKASSSLSPSIKSKTGQENGAFSATVSKTGKSQNSLKAASEKKPTQTINPQSPTVRRVAGRPLTSARKFTNPTISDKLQLTSNRPGEREKSRASTNESIVTTPKSSVQGLHVVSVKSNPFTQPEPKSTSSVEQTISAGTNSNVANSVSNNAVPEDRTIISGTTKSLLDVPDNVVVQPKEKPVDYATNLSANTPLTIDEQRSSREVAESTTVQKKKQPPEADDTAFVIQNTSQSDATTSTAKKDSERVSRISISFKPSSQIRTSKNSKSLIVKAKLVGISENQDQNMKKRKAPPTKIEDVRQLGRSSLVASTDATKMPVGVLRKNEEANKNNNRLEVTLKSQGKVGADIQRMDSDTENTSGMEKPSKIKQTVEPILERSKKEGLSESELTARSRTLQREQEESDNYEIQFDPASPVASDLQEEHLRIRDRPGQKIGLEAECNESSSLKKAFKDDPARIDALQIPLQSTTKEEQADGQVDPTPVNKTPTVRQRQKMEKLEDFKVGRVEGIEVAENLPTEKTRMQHESSESEPSSSRPLNRSLKMSSFTTELPSTSNSLKPDHSMNRRASDSTLLKMREENLRVQQQESNDAFETSLTEMDVSPSILPSQGDLSKLNNIERVKWALRQSHPAASLDRYPLLSPMSSSSNYSTQFASPLSLSPSYYCPCSSLLWQNCPCRPHGFPLSQNFPTSPVTPDPLFSPMVSSDWTCSPFARNFNKLQRRIVRLEMLRQQLRERRSISILGEDPSERLASSRFHLFNNRLDSNF